LCSFHSLKLASYWLWIVCLLVNCFAIILSFVLWHRLSFDLRLLITVLVSSMFSHCCACPLTYGFSLPCWYLQCFPIAVHVLWFMASHYRVGIFNVFPLLCMSFDLRLLITVLVSSMFSHCCACPLIYGFWLSLWCVKFVAIVLYVNSKKSEYYRQIREL
jgi:hypothetical protein